TGIDDPPKKNESGRTPLWWAAWKGLDDVVRLLLERNDVDPNAVDNHVNNRTPLMVAVQNGHEAVVRLLLERNNVKFNVRDRSGKTPLWY
ncbi:ankyrin, partial [Zopfia rhizophila CBS 207.26]